MSYIRRQQEHAPVSLYISFPFSCHCQKQSFGNRLLTASCHEDNSDTGGIILTAPLLFLITEVGSFCLFWSRPAVKGTLLPKTGQAVKLMGPFGTWQFLFIVSLLPQNPCGPCLCVTLVKICCSSMWFCHLLHRCQIRSNRKRAEWLFLLRQFSYLLLLLSANSPHNIYLPAILQRSSKSGWDSSRADSAEPSCAVYLGKPHA